MVFLRKYKIEVNNYIKTNRHITEQPFVDLSMFACLQLETLSRKKPFEEEDDE